MPQTISCLLMKNINASLILRILSLMLIVLLVFCKSSSDYFMLSGLLLINVLVYVIYLILRRNKNFENKSKRNS